MFELIRLFSPKRNRISFPLHENKKRNKYSYVYMPPLHTKWSPHAKRGLACITSCAFGGSPRSRTECRQVRAANGGAGGRVPQMRGGARRLAHPAHLHMLMRSTAGEHLKQSRGIACFCSGSDRLSRARRSIQPPQRPSAENLWEPTPT